MLVTISHFSIQKRNLKLKKHYHKRFGTIALPLAPIAYRSI